MEVDCWQNDKQEEVEVEVFCVWGSPGSKNQTKLGGQETWLYQFGGRSVQTKRRNQVPNTFRSFAFAIITHAQHEKYFFFKFAIIIMEINMSTYLNIKYLVWNNTTILFMHSMFKDSTLANIYFNSVMFT